MTDTLTGLELRSLATSAGELRLALIETTQPEPKPDEVVVRIEATPINPSDLGLLLANADLATLRRSGDELVATIPQWGRTALRPRLDQSLPVGNEGAGTVVRAGTNAQQMLGQRVGMWGGGMYAQFRTIAAEDVQPLPEGISAVNGAAMFINPLTALGFVDTMKTDGHRALVHFAAASNLGQMLNRICLKDKIPLVNVVRSEAQVQLLRATGAEHVLDMTAPDFEVRMEHSVAMTGATIAFDPIGGGRQAIVALSAMEAAASRDATGYSRYGSDVFKQVYTYGALDVGATILDRWVGFSWSVGGWLLTPFLRKAGPVRVAELRQRVVDELGSTFASHYTASISLEEALDPETVRAFNRKATGEKYLITPNG